MIESVTKSFGERGESYSELKFWSIRFRKHLSLPAGALKKEKKHYVITVDYLEGSLMLQVIRLLRITGVATAPLQL